MRIIINKDDIVFIPLNLMTRDVQTSVWTIWKGKCETKVDKVKGGFTCLSNWQGSQVLEISFVEQQIKRLSTRWLKTWWMGWPRYWCQTIGVMDRQTWRVGVVTG